MNKWIKGFLFLTISFLMFGVFSCQNQSKTNVNKKDESQEKEKDELELTLSSLEIFSKTVDISNLNNLKMEVDNDVVAIQSSDIVAKFTYQTQTTPQKLDVALEKTNLAVGENVVNLSVPAVKGKYKAWNKSLKITRKPSNVPDISSEARLEAIEVALVGEKNGKGEHGTFKSLLGFQSDKYGPYEIEEAKTAYIELKMKVAKPSTGDVSIEVANKTTYIEPVTFSRDTEGDLKYFASNLVTLSKGRNIVEVKVKSPDNSKEEVYTIVVQYAGGPDPMALEIKDRKIIPGIYCPAQRKPLEGEPPDLVWLIAIAGW